MNIKFSYLYRDAANYKNYSEVVFSNKTALPFSIIKKEIEYFLIEGTHFYVDNWKLKDLHFNTWDNEIDHTYHEYDTVELTEEDVTKGDISDFLNNIRNNYSPH